MIKWEFILIKIRISQINCNRNYPAHDIAPIVETEIRASIMVLSEPKKQAVTNRSDWVYDYELETVIKVINPKVLVKDQGAEEGIFYVATPLFAI